MGVGYLAVAGTILGIRHWRPVGATAWYCFGAGVFLNSTGQLIEVVYTRVLHDESWPTPASFVYFGLCPCVLTGMVLLNGSRGTNRNWGSMVDATTIATGCGLLAWVFVIGPAVGEPQVSIATQLEGVLFPGADILLIAMLVRLLVGSGARNTSFRLLTASLLVFLAGDVGWAIINQAAWNPGPNAQRLMQTIYFVAYLLLGAAALHRSVRDVAERVSTRESRLNRPLLLALTLASLIAPGLLALEVARGRVTDGLAIVLGSAALFLLVVTRMAQLLKDMEGQAGQLRRLARVDELTGLPNRRAWSSELPQAIERARRDRDGLTIVMIDLDFFKKFDDEYGHQAGDRLLKSAAAAWTSHLRTVDLLARYGGEEFIALLPGAGVAQATEIVDRLRRDTPAGQSFSAGLAIWDGNETSDEVIGRADRALYQAKETGRGHTVLADPAAVEVDAVG